MAALKGVVQMNQMIVYKTSNVEVFVPCDSAGQPDLTKVPDEYRKKLDGVKWDLYPVSTSKDGEIFDEVRTNGYSVRKIVVAFQESA